MPVPIAKTASGIHAAACAKTPFAVGDRAHIVEQQRWQAG